jgi:cation diffusion facilitator family transporter
MRYLESENPHPPVKLERWGWASAAVNLALAILHGWITASSGSLAVAAEVIHNLADLLTAVAVVIGLKLATRRSEAFPYGLYKVENLVAAGLAGTVFLTAYETARRALFAPAASVRVDGWMLTALSATTLVPLVFSHFELRTGRAENSPALIADAREYRVHVFTTGLALAALVSERLRLPVDRVAALLIVLAVVKTGWDLLADAMRVLLDASLDAETLLRTRRVIGADPAVTEVKWVTGRNAGRFRFIEAGVALRVSEPGRTEGLLRRIEASVRAAVPRLERVLIHVEAPDSPWIRCAVPLVDREGTVSEHFGEAPFFALVAVRRGDRGIEEQRVVENPHRSQEKGKGIRVAEWLLAQKPDLLLLREDVRGKGPEYALRDAGVELRFTDRRTLGEALESV